MTVGTLSATTVPRAIRSTSIALVLGLAALGLLFRQEIAAAVRVWIDSTAYNHCFLVLPIVAYLIWDRRALLGGVPIKPMPWAALAALPLSAAWLVAERLGIMEGRQIALICLVELLCLAALGWRMFGRLAAPLLYLFFLVPFGAFIVPALQSFTAKFVDFGLSLTALPYFVDNNVIEIPEGTFYVAQACAGLRFLIASVAFGVLYAVLIYRGWVRRAAFIGVSIVVPIVANGFRALGIVWLGHLLGSAQAAAADHVLYGWIFFSIVILLLVVLGLPFRQDIGRPAAVPSASGRRVRAGLVPSLAAVGIVLAFAAAGPAAARRIDQAAASASVSAPGPEFAGCVRDGMALSPAGAPTGSASQQFSCDSGAILLRVAVFAPRTGPGSVLAEERRIVGQADGEELEVSRLAVPGSAVPWRLAEAPEPPPSAAVSALWIDGQPSAGGVPMRIRQAINSLSGGRYQPVVVAAVLNYAIAQPGPERDWPETRLRAFLTGRPELADDLARLAAGPVTRP